MSKKEIYTIPNIFTLIRLILIPVMWILFFQEQKVIIGILLAVAVTTDFIDGFLARTFNQVTKFGARFDSITDNLLAFSIMIWIPFLLREMFLDHLLIISISGGLAILAWLMATIKYKRNPEFHLISNKIAVLIVGFSVIHAFIFGYNKILLYISAFIFIYMAIEEIVITLTYKEINEDIRSIFH